MKLTTAAAALAASLALAGTAQAAQVYNVEVWKGADDVVASSNNAAELPTGSSVASFTWTGDINWRQEGPQNSSEVFGQFGEFLDGFSTQASNFISTVYGSDAAFLGDSMTIAGDSFVTFFKITRSYVGPAFNGTIHHDDGALLTSNGVTVYSSPAETSEVVAPYHLNAGANNLVLTYVSGNGQPSVLSFSSPVPEPATWAMMIVGFGAAGAMVRGARRKQALALA